jgi:hypothetical protein
MQEGNAGAVAESESEIHRIPTYLFKREIINPYSSPMA